MMKGNSIRFKITAITVAAILVAVLTVFAVSYTPIRTETDQRSVEMMRLIGESKKNELDEYFLSVEQSVSLAANIAADSLDSVVLVECGAAGHNAGQRTDEQTARLDAYIAEHCERVLKIFESAASRTHGVITYYYCINPEISQTEHGFFYSRVGKAGFVEQEPLDARTLEPEDIGHTTWYYTPIQRGRPSWVGPYTAHFLGEILTCSYLVPIYSTGALIGVLGMDIPLEELTSPVSAVRVYKTGFACLCDEEGRALHHPGLREGETLDYADMSIPAETFRAESSGDTPIRYSKNGEEHQLSFSTMRNGLKLVVDAPVNEINAAWRSQLRLISVVTALVVILSAVIVMLSMRVITLPLRRLTAASQRLADADYDVALNYEQDDEIGVLTKAFINMRDQLKKYIADLNRRVDTDMLTGLPNMRCFFRLAEAERRRLRDAGRAPVMLYFDLIGMKYYNRQYGFAEGDKLLRDVGQILARVFGEHSICRYSEDRFAAVSEEAGLEERLGQVFRECQDTNGGNALPLRTGIYQDSMEDVGVSIACDRAKYACDRHRGAFESGWYVFDSDMLRELDGVRYIVRHLDQALEEHWIKVYYQPIVRTVNGRVCDEEALSRWVDPVRGTLPPNMFIPILEKARLIYKLDLYVLDQILEKMKTQRLAGLRVVPISLNLSRSDFDACDIVEEIRARVDAAGIAHDRLTIEITESIIGSDFDFMKTQVQRFQALGFQVWMDDFGSGYSSLDVLQDIHFDLIKFDMRFMKRFSEGEESKLILANLVRMAIALGIDTLCEGVETAEELAFLREIGCSKLQGFYFCRPIPFEELLERYRTGKQIGFENPAESGYYSAVGRANFYEVAVSDNKRDERREYNDMLPFGILELRGDRAAYIRTNQAYRGFMKKHFGLDLLDETENGTNISILATDGFLQQLRLCCAKNSRTYYDETLPDGASVHAVLSPVSKNPISGAQAAAVVVLSVTDGEGIYKR